MTVNDQIFNGNTHDIRDTSLMMPGDQTFNWHLNLPDLQSNTPSWSTVAAFKTPADTTVPKTISPETPGDKSLLPNLTVDQPAIPKHGQPAKQISDTAFDRGEMTSWSNAISYTGISLMLSSSFLPTGMPELNSGLNRFGSLLVGYGGGSALINHDAKALYNSFKSGASAGVKFHNSLAVAADGLAVGASVASFIPSVKEASLGASWAASLMKFGNDAVVWPLTMLPS